MRTSLVLSALVLVSSVLLTSVPSAPGAAAAPRRQVEPWALYDDFNAGPIDPNKWVGGESTAWGEENRRIAGTGLLRMRYTSYAGTTSNTGWWTSSLRANFMNPATITQIQFTTRVQNWGMVGCPGNLDTVTQTRTAAFGAFFNAGTPTPGSDQDNVYARISLRRRVDSLDGPDIFQATANVWRCTNAFCTTFDALPFLVLGLVPVGSLVTISTIWDPANDRFIHQFGANPAINQVYTWPDANPPSFVFKRLEVSNTVPNCTSLPRPYAFISGRFDDVYLNTSAVAALARGGRDRGNSPPYDVAPR